MAVAQLAYRFAYAIEIDGPTTFRGATCDLPEDAAVTALGDFFKGYVVSVSAITTSLPNLFYGVRGRAGASIVIHNAEALIDPTDDWRLSPFTLWHYDRNLGVAREELTGLVMAQSFSQGRVTLTLGTVNDGILRNLLPAATINPAVGSPFDDSASPGAPLPVVFGNEVLLRPPSLNVDNATDGVVSFWDYAAGFGRFLNVERLFGDTNLNRAGLEVYGNWVAAPGSPTYASSTTFTVTGNQSSRYESGMPVRFKLTGPSYLYSVVESYTPGTPSVVTIADAKATAALNGVQLVGDYQVIRHVYSAVTTGILPEPADAQQLTAIRMFGQEDAGMLAMVSNPDFPSGSGQTSPVDVIAEVITNAAWGLSTHVQQEMHPFSLTFARIQCSFAGLDGAVEGALGYDGQQRSAEETLNALLMIARGRLGTDAEGRWTLTIDSELTSAATFHHGPGEESGPRIKRIESSGRVPMNEAVRNLTLHWSPLGRASSRGGVRQREYARLSTKAVSGIGRDLDIVNPFIRSQDVAARVLHYLAEKMKGADERLVFTAGPEARDRVPGEVITVVDTTDGASGEWQIQEIVKTIAEVRITCIRHRTEAYDAPSDVSHSEAPSETPNARTTPGTGTNLLRNPEPAPPMMVADRFFVGPYLPDVPHGWSITSQVGQLSELEIDKSVAVRERTISGHYCRMVWDSVDDYAAAGDFSGLMSDQYAVPSVTADYMVSFWGDADDGWYVVLIESGAGGRRLVTLLRDDTDTDGNGWSRFYARFRPLAGTEKMAIAICASAAGAYEFSGVMVAPVTGSARKPPAWRRGATAPAVLTRSQEVTLDGSATYSAPLIKGGDYVLGATCRATGEIVFGTGTKFSLGTATDPDVWARDITDPFAVTSSRNFRTGTIHTFYPGDTSAVVTFDGTATSGKIMIVVEYTRSAPTPGD